MTSSFPIEAYRTDHYLDYEFFTTHKPEFKATYDILADDISRKTMEHYLYACISGDVSLLNGDPKPHQYFNDITINCDCSIFVDCGAFVGDTVMDAMNFYGSDKICRVYSFEPDEANIQRILGNVKSGSIPREKFTLIRAGCSDSHATLAFSSNGDGSAICEDGDITIDVDSIDNLVKAPATFIKMDIEGYELDAIRGASKTIKRNRPTLCICVYHKREDLIAIPKLIMSIAGDGAYRFYLRHHQTNLTELVLYAIPR
jgi:FkbM family methyltransferase